MTEEKQEIAVAEARPKAIAMVPANVEDMWRFATAIAKSAMVPSSYLGSRKTQYSPEQVAGNVFVAIQSGAEIGLSPMQAVQSIYVINGTPTLFGDGMMAVVRASGKAKVIDETMDDTDPKNPVASCRTVRTDTGEEIERTFSHAQAQKMGLTQKPGPWQNDPRRMLQMRARSRCLRDAFADVLRGMSSGDEMMDITDVSYEVNSPAPAAPTREAAPRPGPTVTDLPEPTVVDVTPDPTPTMPDDPMPPIPESLQRTQEEGPAPSPKPEATAQTYVEDGGGDWVFVDFEGKETILPAVGIDKMVDWLQQFIEAAPALNTLEGLMESNQANLQRLQHPHDREVGKVYRARLNKLNEVTAANQAKIDASMRDHDQGGDPRSSTGGYSPRQTNARTEDQADNPTDLEGR